MSKLCVRVSHANRKWCFSPVDCRASDKLKEEERKRECFLWMHRLCDEENGIIMRCLWLCGDVLLLPLLCPGDCGR